MLIPKQKVIVTGSYGFVGRNLCESGLIDVDNLVRIGGKQSFDLTNQKYVDYMFNEHQPDVVIHLAARVGGIGANRENPGLFMHENLIMGANILDTARRYGKLKKLIMVGTVCSYPKFTPVPFSEKDIWNGYPEETNAPYGIAKKAIMEMSLAYHKQYGLNVINLIPTNLYGNYDNFDPDYSHVIPALFLKAYKAIKEKRPFITCWGDGSATREFLHVLDLCNAIALAIKSEPGPEPINIGSGLEVSIKEITRLICEHLGYTGSVNWDTSKPNGQPRRCLDISRAKSVLGYSPMVDINTGLTNLNMWFQKQAKIGTLDGFLNSI